MDIPQPQPLSGTSGYGNFDHGIAAGINAVEDIFVHYFMTLGITAINCLDWRRDSRVRPGVNHYTYQHYIRAEIMSDRKTESASYKNRFAFAFVGAIGGFVIAEIARQMVQLDQVSSVRLVGLIVCSLVVGGMIGFEIASRRSRPSSRLPD